MNKLKTKYKKRCMEVLSKCDDIEFTYDQKTKLYTVNCRFLEANQTFHSTRKRQSPDSA